MVRKYLIFWFHAIFCMGLLSDILHYSYGAFGDGEFGINKEDEQNASTGKEGSGVDIHITGTNIDEGAAYGSLKNHDPMANGEYSFSDAEKAGEANAKEVVAPTNEGSERESIEEFTNDRGNSSIVFEGLEDFRNDNNISSVDVTRGVPVNTLAHLPSEGSFERFVPSSTKSGEKGFVEGKRSESKNKELDGQILRSTSEHGGEGSLEVGRLVVDNDENARRSKPSVSTGDGKDCDIDRNMDTGNVGNDSEFPSIKKGGYEVGGKVHGSSGMEFGADGSIDKDVDVRKVDSAVTGDMSSDVECFDCLDKLIESAKSNSDGGVSSAITSAEESARRLEMIGLRAAALRQALDIEKRNPDTVEALKASEYAEAKENLISKELSAYKEVISLYAAQLTHIRRRLDGAAAVVKEQGENFAARSRHALSIVNSKFDDFDRRVDELEGKVEVLFSSSDSDVSETLKTFSNRLQEAAGRALQDFTHEINSLVRRLHDTNADLAQLLEISKEARASINAEIAAVDSRMQEALQLFDVVTQETQEKSAVAQQKCVTNALESFRKKVSGMHLKEHMLENLVANFYKEMLHYQQHRGLSRVMTFMDLSAAFAGPRPQSVCSILTHLVHKEELAKDVAVVFVHTVPLADADGNRSETTNDEVVVPTGSIIRAVAASWQRRTAVYGKKAHSYGVIRVEGTFMEHFIMPFMESETFEFGPGEPFRVTRSSEFGARLAETVKEAGRSGVDDSTPYTLVVYLGKLEDDPLQPQPSRSACKGRIELTRQILRSFEPFTTGLVRQWARLQSQLDFLNNAGAIIKNGVPKGEAAQIFIQRSDVEALVFSGSLYPPPCRIDPHFRKAFHYILVKALPLKSKTIAIPEDTTLAAGLSSILTRVRLGGASCPVVMEASKVTKKHFWNRTTAVCSFKSLESNLSQDGGSMGLRPSAKDGKHSEVRDQLGPNVVDLHHVEDGIRVSPSSRTAKCDVLNKASPTVVVKHFAKVVERILLHTETWAKGYTLYVQVCIEGTNCPN